MSITMHFVLNFIHFRVASVDLAYCNSLMSAVAPRTSRVLSFTPSSILSMVSETQSVNDGPAADGLLSKLPRPPEDIEAVQTNCIIQKLYESIQYRKSNHKNGFVLLSSFSFSLILTTWWYMLWSSWSLPLYIGILILRHILTPNECKQHCWLLQWAMQHVFGKHWPVLQLNKFILVHAVPIHYRGYILFWRMHNQFTIKNLSLTLS